MINCIPQELNNSAGIYQITCIENGKLYIGSTLNFLIRYTGHKSSLYRGSGVNKHLQSMHDTYGPKGLVFSVLCLLDRLCDESDSSFKARLLEKEQAYIDLVKSGHTQYGMNNNNPKPKPKEKRPVVVKPTFRKTKQTRIKVVKVKPAPVIMSSEVLSNIKVAKFLLSNDCPVNIIARFLNVPRGLPQGIRYSNSFKGIALTQSDVQEFNDSGMLAQFNQFAADDAEKIKNKHLQNQPRGSKIGTSKLTENIVITIKKDLSGGYSVNEIASKYDLTKNVIRSIKTERRWAHITI